MNPVDLGARALVAILLLSMVSTLGALAVCRRFADAAAIGGSTNRIVAHLMEFGLFFDEPLLVLRAQRDLFRENLRLLRLIAAPCAMLALPFVIFFASLDATFGRAPLAVGVPAVVTAAWSGAAPLLETPEGIRVETPGMRIVSADEVSWRIRPVRNTAGELKIAGGPSPERIYAGSGFVYALPFRADPIRIPYPPATIFHLNWILWYIFASAGTALAWSLL